MAFTKNNSTDNIPHSTIAKGTTITGNFNSDGDIRIDGNIEGNIKTAGKIIIGKTGNIKGDIFCKTLDVSGKINGKINVNEMLSLKADSNILGDIITQKITIEPGAILNGTCKMGKEINNPKVVKQETK